MKMAITWTIVVLGALLHGMKCDPVPNTSLSSTSPPVLTPATPLSSTGSLVLPQSTSSISNESPVLPTSTSLSLTGSPDPTKPTSLSSTGSPDSTKPTSLSSAGSPDSTKPTSLSSAGLPDSTKPTSPSSAGSPDSTKPTSPSSAGSPDSTKPTSPSSAGSPDSTKPTSLSSAGSPDSTPSASMGSTRPTSQDPTNPSLKSTTKDSPPQSNANDSLTEHSTTTIQPNTGFTAPNHSPQNSPTTVISSVKSNTANSSILATTTHNENDKTSINQRDPSAITTNPAPYSKSTGSQSIQTPEAKTTTAPKTSVLHPGSRRLDNDLETSSSTPRLPYVFDLSSSERGILFKTCKTLGDKLKGNCSVSLEFKGNQLVATVTINANQNISINDYKPPQKKADVSEETIPDTLVAILASCGALVLILCCFAAYCTYHRRSYRKNQQHLTEEMQTVENGYHDNPTLEVMEVVPEMQEKKLALNGEFNDSWIVPIDNLLKDDIPDEEDTHL